MEMIKKELSVDSDVVKNSFFTACEKSGLFDEKPQHQKTAEPQPPAYHSQQPVYVQSPVYSQQQQSVYSEPPYPQGYSNMPAQNIATENQPAKKESNKGIIIIVAVITVAVYIYLKYTKQGYEISVVGESENTARYIGINVKKVIVRTLIVSGALCGIAGLLLVAGTNHTISTTTAGGRGFTAITTCGYLQ